MTQAEKASSVSGALALDYTVFVSDLSWRLVPLSWSRATLAQEAVCITVHCRQKRRKGLPMTDKRCLVWSERKNKALGITGAGGKTFGTPEWEQKKRGLWRLQAVVTNQEQWRQLRRRFLPPSCSQSHWSPGQGAGRNCVMAGENKQAWSRKPSPFKGLPPTPYHFRDVCWQGKVSSSGEWHEATLGRRLSKPRERKAVCPS